MMITAGVAELKQLLTEAKQDDFLGGKKNWVSVFSIATRLQA
jgi:hypothetical protein